MTLAEKMARYWVLEERRRELEREARQLRAEAELLGDEIEQAIRDSGKTQLRRGEYLATLVEVRAPVAWKQEFIRVAGSEEAVRLAMEAPTVQRLQVSRIE